MLQAAPEHEMEQDNHEHILVLILSEWESQSGEEASTLQFYLTASITYALNHKSNKNENRSLCPQLQTDLNKVKDIFQISLNEPNDWMVEP